MAKIKWVRGTDAYAVVGDYLITVDLWNFSPGRFFSWSVVPLTNIWAANIACGRCATEAGAMRCAGRAARRLMAEKAEMPE